VTSSSDTFTWTKRELRRRLASYMTRCFESRAPVRAAGFAVFLGLTRPYVSRTYQAVCGELLLSALHRLQVAEAKRQLRATKRSTAEIARATGFGGAATFYRVFLAEVGMTPTEFRHKCENGT
jgi:AraC-like DNA-binding protein